MNKTKQTIQRQIDTLREDLLLQIQELRTENKTLRHDVDLVLNHELGLSLQQTRYIINAKSAEEVRVLFTQIPPARAVYKQTYSSLTKHLTKAKAKRMEKNRISALC